MSSLATLPQNRLGILRHAPGTPAVGFRLRAAVRRRWLPPDVEGEAGSRWPARPSPAGGRPEAARRAGLEVVEKLLTDCNGRLAGHALVCWCRESLTVTWAASPSWAGEPLAAEHLVDHIDQRPP